VTHNSALTFELHCYPSFPLGARALILYIFIYIVYLKGENSKRSNYAQKAPPYVIHWQG
jgi:hypothetical protein